MKDMTVKNALSKTDNKEIKKLLELWMDKEEASIHLAECSNIVNTCEDYLWGILQHLFNYTSGIGSLDWKADNEEFISSIEDVLLEVGLNFDAYNLDINSDDAHGVYEWLQFTQYAIKNDKYSLISIDTQSDQYVFTIVLEENSKEFVDMFNSTSKQAKSFVTASRISPVKQEIEIDEEEMFEEEIDNNSNKTIFKTKYDDFTDKNTCTIGTYPQSLVDDEEIISKLNKLSLDKVDGVYELDGNKYIKSIIKLNSSTPKYTFYSGLFENGTMAFDGDIAYFKFEPLEWIIIQENSKYARIICTKGIDRSIVDESEKNREVKDIPDNYNYYEYSKLRNFLNNEFYNLAFNDDEKELIKTMKIDNSPKSTSAYALGKKFDYKDTEDKVHTLSYKEAKKTDWGFESGEYSYSNLRLIKATDYSFSKGLTKSSKDNSVSWCLRSPKTYASSKGQTVLREERDSTSMAARPVIVLDKSKVTII